MRNILGRIPAGLLLAGLLVLAGCEQEEAGGAQTDAGPPPPTPVTVVTLTTQPVDITTVLPGRASPYQIAEVRPQVTGILQERLFREGADVEQGEPLYRIDPAVYQAAYETAKAELAQAGATGLVIANNQPGSFAGSLGGQSSLPVVAVSQADGERLRQQVASGPTRVKLAVDADHAPRMGVNVQGSRPGGSRTVVIDAHYDSVSAGPGARSRLVRSLTKAWNSARSSGRTRVSGA